MKPLEKLLEENQPLDDYIFDEIGRVENFLGWYGFLIISGEYYIVHKLEDFHRIKKYSSKKSISKAWDHICNRYELWYRTQFYQQTYGPAFDD